MRSDELDAETETRSQVGTLYRLLYPAFGFFAWAIHFLVVYIAAAVACVLGLGAADEAARSAFTTALVVVTVATAAGVLLHAWRTHRRHGEVRDRRFLVNITMGHDAVAAVAILWQLFPILLVPACQ
jgi:hypothetical protein